MNAFINLTKSFLGTSVFALPWAMNQGGIWASILCLAFFAVVSAHTLKLLGRCRKVSKQLDPSFVDLGHEAFGPAGAKVVTTAIVAMSIGVCAAYLVFISGTVESVLMAHGSTAIQHFTAAHSYFPMVLILPFAVPLSWMRDFKYIAYTSKFGIVFVVMAMCAVLLYGLQSHSGADMANAVQQADFIKPKTFPLFFGNAAFLFW
jgi:amino acid permease